MIGSCNGCPSVVTLRSIVRLTASVRARYGGDTEESAAVKHTVRALHGGTGGVQVDLLRLFFNLKEDLVPFGCLCRSESTVRQHCAINV